MSESSLLDYFNGELSDAEEKEILEWKAQLLHGHQERTLLPAFLPGL